MNIRFYALLKIRNEAVAPGSRVHTVPVQQAC